MYEGLAECFKKPKNLIQVIRALEYDKLVPFETGGLITKKKDILVFERIK